MPKILNDIENRIMETARQEILAHPDHAPSLRLIAEKTGIAVGTIYNYYPNKETLMIKVLIHDWQDDLEVMDSRIQSASGFLEGIAAVYDAVEHFQERYEQLFQNIPAGKGSAEFKPRHIQFRNELQSRVELLMKKFNLNDLLDCSTLYTEALIASAVQSDLDFNALTVFTKKLFSFKEAKDNVKL